VRLFQGQRKQDPFPWGAMQKTLGFLTVSEGGIQVVQAVIKKQATGKINKQSKSMKRSCLGCFAVSI